MANKNRVLSIDETAAIPDGDQVFVECRGLLSEIFSTVHTKEGQKLVDIYGPFDIGGEGHAAGNFRVWALPQPPTPEERDANPWEEVDQ